MKKAVIQTGGKQYLVSKGDKLDVDLIKTDKKSVTFKPLLTIDGDIVEIGTPQLENAIVLAEIIDSSLKGEKTTSVRYKAKKRVRKVRGHRQQYTKIEIKTL